MRTFTEVAWDLSQPDPTVDRVGLVGSSQVLGLSQPPDLDRGSRDSHSGDAMQLLCWRIVNCGGRNSTLLLTRLVLTAQ